MLTLAEQNYLKLYPGMSRLTFDGINDLYNHPRYGAYTIQHCMYLDEVYSNPPPKPVDKCEFVNVYNMEMSTELYRSNERCIQQHGHSIFLL